MLQQLNEKLANISVCEGKEHNAKEVYQLQLANTYYNGIVFNNKFTYEDCLKDILEKPDNTANEQKKFLLFYMDNYLMGIMDLIIDYPSEEYCFIGLFMIDPQFSSKGEGTKIIKALKLTLQEMGYRKLKLACNLENKKGLRFWGKQAFYETCQTMQIHNEITWHLSVMECQL